LIVGSWVSEGADIAPLLSDPSVGLTKLEAEFSAEGSFLVRLQNQEGYSFELAGVYELGASAEGSVAEEGVIHTITLRQREPEASLSEGIWRVEGELLRYEVVQVDPPLPGSQLPPTQEAGFGSSSRGALGSDNVQLYRRRP
jgi:hypothetical protein